MLSFVNCILLNKLYYYLNKGIDDCFILAYLIVYKEKWNELLVKGKLEVVS